MTDNTPTANQRALLDVVGNIPPEWELNITYPTLPEVAHRFEELPELVLTTVDGEQTHTITVQAVITDERVFHGYLVTTTYPEPAVLTADCRERRLTSLSQQELLAERIGVTRRPASDPTSGSAANQSLSLSAAASLAGYYAATIDVDAVAVADDTPPTVSAADD